MSDNAFYISFWTLLAITILGLTAIITWSIRADSEMMIRSGYTLEYVIGKESQQWVKHN